MFKLNFGNNLEISKKKMFLWFLTLLHLKQEDQHMSVAVKYRTIWKTNILGHKLDQAEIKISLILTKFVRLLKTKDLNCCHKEFNQTLARELKVIGARIKVLETRPFIK